MRLTDHLAAKRSLYARAVPTMPDVLMIDVPHPYAGATLPLGRYYPIILENVEELDEAEAFLRAWRPALVLPDLFERRPSRIEGDCVVIARYRPPACDWPWMLLYRWPQAYTASVAASNELFARGAYTSEVFATRDELMATEARLRSCLARHSMRSISVPQSSAGHA